MTYNPKLSFFHFLILLFFVATLPLNAEDVINPVADPAAVVTSGNARFTVLTSQMIRIQYSSTAQFEGRATFSIVNRRLPVPEFTTETSYGYLYIRTSDYGAVDQLYQQMIDAVFSNDQIRSICPGHAVIPAEGLIGKDRFKPLRDFDVNGDIL